MWALLYKAKLTKSSASFKKSQKSPIANSPEFNTKNRQKNALTLLQIIPILPRL
jgi:hypothetical protein